MLYKITKIDSNKKNDFEYTSDNELAKQKSFDDDYEVEILEDDGTSGMDDENLAIEKNKEVH